MIQYILTSPVKEYSSEFEEWLQTVLNFKPPPTKIAIATEDEDFPNNSKYELIQVKNRIEIFSEERQIRISSAREELRKWTIKQNIEGVIFLDSDVFPVTPYFPVIMFGTLQLLGANIFFNDFPNKDGYPPTSLGCVATTSSLLKLLTFHPVYGVSDETSFVWDLMLIKKFVTPIKVFRGKIVQVKHKGELSQDPDLLITEITPENFYVTRGDQPNKIYKEERVQNSCIN